MEILHITKENYQQEVLGSDKPVLLDFWADWCGPCKMLAPVLDEIAAERSDIKVCKVNADTEKELARQFKVMGIPTLVVMKDGKATSRVTGVKGKDEILALL